MTDHPITPPPKLVQQWWKEADQYQDDPKTYFDHVATEAAQWDANQEHWARQHGHAQACILELRARVKVLEDAAHKHIVETNSNILALFSRVESLEAAERQTSKVYQISKPLKLTAEQQAELQALLTPNFRVGMTPTSTSSQVDSSLVDQVARAIGRDDEPVNWEEEARAAIRMVALWLNEAPLNLYPGDRGIVVNALYDQANQ